MVDKDTILGGVVSVGLHVAVLALLLISVPLPTKTVESEDIKVELVPPPTTPPQSSESAQQSSGESAKAAQAPAPQAFEAASDLEKENTQIEPTTDSPEESADTSKPVENPSESKQQQASSSEPVLSANKSSVSVASLEKQLAPMIKARRIYSKDALSNPRVKQALGKLSPTDRVIQICGIEALEQIRHHRPDIVPDMMARTGGALTASSLKMSHGAFRSRSNWYNLDFDCKINPEDMNVTSFQYAIGDVIPKKDWSRRELPAD
ncbi:DUF930 domain-containing protein [Brucella gallinifaecis]|uniref:DUF930 domain-containing protein n=1 Tax=Brucella gallinifaecis TaxID=215590 RepID=UPI002361CDED|nr:DUF930 domain-containing protein [Brucella gallinifaecis]